MSEERIHVFFTGTGFPERSGGSGGMSEERVPTLAELLANLQDTMLAHDKDFKIVAAMTTTMTRRVARMGEEVAAQEDRLRVIADRLESLGRDRYAAEQLTTLYLRVAALEAKLAAHLESIGQLAQRVERLERMGREQL